MLYIQSGTATGLLIYSSRRSGDVIKSVVDVVVERDGRRHGRRGYRIAWDFLDLEPWRSWEVDPEVEIKGFMGVLSADQCEGYERGEDEELG